MIVTRPYCDPPRAAKLVTELAGTLLFVSVIALSGPTGSFASLAIGAALMAMVYMGGHVSGAHYNPAVSFAAFLRRKMSAVDMLAWTVQLAGAALIHGVQTDNKQASGH